MPIGLLVWNIQRFGINKLGVTDADPRGARGSFILDTVQRLNPDIFVIIEVQTAQVDGAGSLISDASGGAGVRAFLGTLRTLDNRWMLVPPVVLNVDLGRRGERNYSEGIAVYYRSDKLQFTGPWRWDGQQPQPPGIAASQDYPAAWAGVLPAAQQQYAGQHLFYSAGVGAARQEILFGAPGENVLYYRRPWLTTFTDTTVVPNRNISLLSLHFAPNANDAEYATALIASIPEMNAPLGANEVRVIAGDFNLDSLAPAQNQYFDQLTANNLRIPGPVGRRQNPNLFLATNLYTQHLHGASVVRSVSTASTAGAGPGYGYLVNNGYDNILTAYGAGAGAPNGAAVVNRVVANVPGVPTYLTTPILLINLLPVGQGWRDSVFRWLINYGAIGGSTGASDHLPVYIQI